MKLQETRPQLPHRPIKYLHVLVRVLLANDKNLIKLYSYNFYSIHGAYHVNNQLLFNYNYIENTMSCLDIVHNYTSTVKF